MRDKILGVGLFLFLGAGFVFAGYIINSFQTEWIFSKFQSPVSQKDLQEHPYKDYKGSKAGEDIPILQSADEYHNGTYDRNDYVTVVADRMIPTKGYHLKDTSDRNRTDRVIAGRRRRNVSKPLKEYVKNPIWDKYLYQQLYVIPFDDGTAIGAYVDGYYAGKVKKGKGYKLPIGILQTAGSQEKEWLVGIEKKYTKEIKKPINTDYVLSLYSDELWKERKLIDLIIRITAGAAVFLILCAAAVVLHYRISKR